jgi:uric acid-xanthine permease
MLCGKATSNHAARYHIGTGLISVVGTTFAIIPVASGYFAQMYANGTCKMADDGSRLPCPDAYGAVIGTAALCALLEIGLAFVPPRILHKIFPPIVTGPTVMLIGASLVQTGFQSWAGGSGPCNAKPADGFFKLCPNVAAPHALPWGSAQFIGLGFLVFVTILLCERFGSPIMRSASVICGELVFFMHWMFCVLGLTFIGLLTGCIVAGATGYFDKSTIDAAPAVSFIWVHTFKLSVSGPLILPMLTIYLICACEAIGDITATSDVSNLEVEGPQFDSRIQGGVLADGCNSRMCLPSGNGKLRNANKHQLSPLS